MPVYDSTFILNPQLEEGGLDGHIKEAVDLIAANGGKVIRENRLGMRRMAYEIQKLTQGYYVSLVYEGNNQTVMELERYFRLDESCLRFLTCHYQDFSRKKERKESAGPAKEDKPEIVEKSADESRAEAEKPAAETETKTETKVAADDQEKATAEKSEPEGTQYNEEL
jgi:small subunit ribosomal protein S6